MARIPQHIVDQIYAAIDIIDVIGDYVQLKKRGGNFEGFSPFGNEKTPSFKVNPKKNIYKDFSSGKGGNAINFLIEMEGYSYVEALRHLAKKYGIELEEEEETEEQKVSRNKRDSLFIVNEFAASWWHDQLMLSEEGKNIGLSYLKERGLLQSTIDDFQLGYAPTASQSFTSASVHGKYQLEYLEELGIVSRNDENRNLYDFFSRRVMFPIIDEVGKIVGFGGRILENSKSKVKYLNSIDSLIFHKSKILYGLYQARQEIRSKDLCILTEGYMDVILLAQNGVRNVVSSSGTGLSIDQVHLIRRFTKNVLLIYDGDAAGVEAALDVVDLLVEEGMKSEVVILPDNHDPDSYIREFGANGFQEYAKAEAMSFVDFKMRVLTEGRDAEDPQVQTEVVKALADTLALQTDLVERQMYTKRVAQRLDITESLMTYAVEQAIQARAKIAQQEAKREEARKPRAGKKHQNYRTEKYLPEAYQLFSKSFIQKKIEFLQCNLKPVDADLSIQNIFRTILESDLDAKETIWAFFENNSKTSQYKGLIQRLRSNSTDWRDISELGLSTNERLLFRKIHGVDSFENDLDSQSNLRYQIALYILIHSSKSNFLSQGDSMELVPLNSRSLESRFFVLESALKLALKICREAYSALPKAGSSLEPDAST